MNYLWIRLSKSVFNLPLFSMNCFAFCTFKNAILKIFWPSLMLMRSQSRIVWFAPVYNVSFFCGCFQDVLWLAAVWLWNVSRRGLSVFILPEVHWTSWSLLVFRDPSACVSFDKLSRAFKKFILCPDLITAICGRLYTTTSLDCHYLKFVLCSCGGGVG